MRYIKTFEKFQAIVGTGNRPELAGELVKDDEDAIYPSDLEITGHIQSQIRSVRLRKIGKSPKVKLRKAAPTYPDLQKRNKQNQDTTLFNSLPSQS